MKKSFLFFSLGLLTVLLAACGSHRSQAYYDYESKVIATELDGSYTIRAWGRGRNAADAFVQAQKTAVYDVIFNQIQFATGTANTTSGVLKPLLLEVNAKTKYEDYFNVFFADGGEYKNYCSLKEKRSLSTKYQKTNAQTQAQVTVCVFRKELKEKLIQDNILKY
ncbi:MAG: hypothetical protein IJS05_06175 [Paludibacteraceae bacterium]|nr:hypothetical protein [Paludibacteraceae bacterium]